MANLSGTGGRRAGAVPSEPQGFHAVQLGRGEARLSWSPPADPRGPVDAYDVTWCSSSCSTLAVSRLARHVVLSDVQASTHYKFRVRAKNVLDGISFEGPEAHLAALTPPEGECLGPPRRRGLSSTSLITSGAMQRGFRGTSACLLLGRRSTMDDVMRSRIKKITVVCWSGFDAAITTA